MDAVGSTSEANTLYKEGTGYPALTPFSIDYSFYRDTCGKGGSITNFAPCALNTPKDTNNNAADFVFVDTDELRSDTSYAPIRPLSRGHALARLAQDIIDLDIDALKKSAAGEDK